MTRHTLTALLAAGLGLCLGEPAQAAWLQLCPSDKSATAAATAADPIEVRMPQPDGSTLRAAISETLPPKHCQQLALELSAADVVALKPITPSLANELGAGLSLSGTQQGQRFLISDVTAAQPSASPGRPIRQTLPLGSNLLTRLQATTFGAEQRATASLDAQGLLLQCRPGRQPAGVVLSVAGHGLSRARSLLQLRGSGNGRFELISATATQAARESGTRLGHFKATPAEQDQAYALPQASGQQDWQSWTLACPAEAAQLRLKQLQLKPEAHPIPARAGWIWQADQWQQSPETVLALAKAYAMGTLYLTVPLADGRVRDPERLAAFVRQAGAAGVVAWAVDGDPHMVKPEERAATLKRMQAYARFNRSQPPGARLGGVQFDVEPYLLAGHELATEGWEQRYAELVRSLHESAPQLPLEMVLPFWWADKQALLERIAPWLSGLVVMDYRTDPDEIDRFAVPFLDWGARHGKRVRIALEAGPIAPETRYRYEQALAGELWQVQLDGQAFLLLLRQAQKNPHGMAFRPSDRRELDGSATSFHGDTARLLRQLPALESVFSAWPGFAGMALHEVR